MNSAEKMLLDLLKCALHRERCEPAADTDWGAVFREANNQTVTALAAGALPSTLSKEEKQPWQEAVYRQMSVYVRYTAAQDELCCLLSENGIPMVIVKGSAAAMYYPEPFRRAFGDIDFVVPREQMAQAYQLLLVHGYTLKDESNGRHTGFEKNGLRFELHSRYSRDVDMEEYIVEGIRTADQKTIDGHSFPALPRLANGLVLLDHMRAHLRSGLGLRQLIDWMMYVERELDDAYWKETFFSAAREKSLDKLAVTATRICQKYLGLTETITWCGGADEKLCEIVTESMLSSGNFGRKNGAGGTVERVATSILQRGFFHNLQFAGEHNWKTLRKHPWLRPFAWLYQLFRYAGQVLRARNVLRSRLGKTEQDDLTRSKARYEMLKQLNIDVKKLEGASPMDDIGRAAPGQNDRNQEEYNAKTTR